MYFTTVVPFSQKLMWSCVCACVWTLDLLGGGDFTQFSAVCWMFGRYLYQTLRYPVGLVESCWGGTPVEAWSSTRVLHKCGITQGAQR